MTRIAEARDWVRRIFLLMGARGVFLFVLESISSFLLAGIEYCLAIFLVVFLFTLKLVETPQIPSWFPVDIHQLSAPIVWSALFLVGLFQSIFQVVAYQSKILLTEGAHARMRMALGYKILRSEGSTYIPLSEVNLYTAELFPKATSFIFHFTQLISFLILAFTIAAGMFYLAPGEAVVGIAGLGMMAGIVLSLNRITNRISSKVPAAQEDLERSKVRITRNWLLIKILRIQDREYEEYLGAVFSYYKHSVIAYFFGNLGWATMPVFGIIIIATTVVASQHFFGTSPANLLGFLYLFVRFQQMVANGSQLIGGLFTCRTQFEKTAAFMSTISPEEIQEAFSPVGEFKLSAKRICTAGSKLKESQESWKSVGDDGLPPPVAVNGITYTWPGIEAPALSHISFNIAPGSHLGIVGPNGSGKSTLLSIMLGALKPSEGSVLIGSQQCSVYVRRNSDSIAYVGPEPYLIHGTIRDNLTYGIRKECSEDEIWSVLKMVRLDEFVNSIPGGIHYMIQENGDGLSSGQKQRISIARSFLRRPSLLVMDEPSANLDDDTELCILKRLRELKGRCTVVLVSHKPGILLEVDDILNLEIPSRGRQSHERSMSKWCAGTVLAKREKQ